MQRFVWTCLVSGFLIAAPARAQSATPAAPNPLGWSWAYEPVPLDGPTAARAIGEITLTVARLADDSVFATVSRAGAMELTGLRTEYRLVGLDAAGARHEFRQRSSAGSQSITILSFQIPASPAMVKLGVEVLRPEGRRLVAQEAVRNAKEQGLEVLPLPEVGKPLAFELTDVKDQTIRSQDLHGKLVLIDCWATWCGPCMAKMPKLKALYERWHEKGLEVIGVSFDNSLAECLETAGKQKLPWPLVHVSEEEAVRDLWEKAAGVSTLPRLFLIDGEGMVREDFYPTDIEKTLAPYFTK
jgi:thiol-disulfide isomerase/thioredoxin